MNGQENVSEIEEANSSSMLESERYWLLQFSFKYMFITHTTMLKLYCSYVFSFKRIYKRLKCILDKAKLRTGLLSAHFFEDQLYKQ